MMETIATILGLIGVGFNIKKSPICFLVWIPSNAIWMVLDWNKDLKGQAFIMAVMLISAVYGYFDWRKK